MGQISMENRPLPGQFSAKINIYLYEAHIVLALDSRRWPNTG